MSTESKTAYSSGAMMRVSRIAVLFLLAMVSATAALGQQSPCPTSILEGTSSKASGDTICVVPQVYGPGGLVGTDNGGPLNATQGHEVHFQASAIRSFGAVNSEIGIELAQLPIAAPVAIYIGGGGTITPTESFGPVLTERAETIGKHRIFIGASYQYFNFDKVDGVDLRNFGVVLTHEPEPTVCTTTPSVPCLPNPSEGGTLEPIYTRDIVATENRIDLKVHQVTIVGTYGITGRLDLSVAIPVLDVRMGMTSNATIFNFEPPPVNHSFDLASPTSTETPIDAYTADFHNFKTATEVGDVTIRAKFEAWRSQSERSSIAVGLDGRLPTGDAENFLGSGTWGVRPFIAFTHSGVHLSPHATAGFESNGYSVLAGDVTTQPVTKGKLPDLVTYSAGADVGFAKRISFSVDFLGETLLHAPEILQTTFTDFSGGTHSDIALTTANVSELNVATGAKLRLAGPLLLVGNVLFRTNHAGLHYAPAPLIGLSYTFR